MTLAVPTMPVHESVCALYVECSVQMNCQAPFCVNVFVIGGLFG